MAPIRRLADVVIDTTKFNVHELRQFIIDRFQNPGSRPLMISVVSFGFRYGVPGDADLVFDVRFLPNPHFVQRLRPFTGKDPSVARYIRSFPQTGQFLQAHREPAGVSNSALHPRGEKLSHGRAGMHRRSAPLGGPRGSDPRAACKSAVMPPRSSIAIWTRPSREDAFQRLQPRARGLLDSPIAWTFAAVALQHGRKLLNLLGFKIDGFKSGIRGSGHSGPRPESGTWLYR